MLIKRKFLVDLPKLIVTGLRILVATDALAHGKDVPDIDIVIIYGMPRDKDPSVLWQMFGRAARAANRKGMAVLIGDDWAIGDRSTVFPSWFSPPSNRPDPALSVMDEHTPRDAMEVEDIGAKRYAETASK